MNTQEKYYTIREVMEMFNISRAMLDRAIRNKDFSIIKIGRSVRISQSELNNWIRVVPSRRQENYGKV